MTILSYIYPITIAKFSSNYNHDIRVQEEYGQLKLLVNGSRQSGVYIAGLWQSAFRHFGLTPGDSLKNILVLGVAGGTVIKLLRQLYPQAEIVGVEIDPLMLEIGKKYFKLDQVDGLRLVRADARQFIKQVPTSQKYDLVIVDLFFGRNIPNFVSSPSFLATLKKLLGPQGLVILNFLREKEYAARSEKLYQTLKKIFGRVVDFERDNNRFFCVSV